MEDRINELVRLLTEAGESIRLLFDRTDGSLVRDTGDTLEKLRIALKNGGENDRINAETALDRLAAKTSGGSFRADIDRALLARLAARFPNAAPAELDRSPDDNDAAFYCAHAKRLAARLKTLLPDCADALSEPAVPGTLPRLAPSVRKLSTAGSLFLRLASGALALEIRRQFERGAVFGSGRVFRHAADGAFVPLTLHAVRNVEDFYGYRDARKFFLDHFRAFSEGKNNLPLLISSLPGLGKTQMTISHSLHFPGITLILPAPDDISTGLEQLIAALARHPEKKFLVFFDDIDASTANWFYFRANIGGIFSLPDHISIAIASNQRFPANISSRGRGFEFPIFDEIRCQEMVADFLLANGMTEAPPALVSVIASDYVEEFGQKMFEELSPRTLVRYLREYHANPKKRREMLETSRNELITKPDAQVFYDENIKLMRSIYGDSVLAELRKKEYGVDV